MLQLLLQRCSTSVPPTAAGAADKGSCYGHSPTFHAEPQGNHGTETGIGHLCPFYFFCCKFALRTSHWGFSPQSSGRGKAELGQLWLSSVLLCKVPAAEQAEEAGSVQGPIPHFLHCRTRRTPAAASPLALRGARACKSFRAEPSAKLSLQVAAFILPPFSIVWCPIMALDVFPPLAC